jgi:hypothetical protein
LPEVVDEIANISVPRKRDRCHFSFATKYCSWHRPEATLSGIPTCSRT